VSETSKVQAGSPSIKSHLDLSILNLHAALARAGTSPDQAIDIILEAQDELCKAVDILLAEVEADEQFVKLIKNDKRKKAA
jgi:hypothetical protein